MELGDGQTVDGQTLVSEEEKLGLKIKSITLQRELDVFEFRNIAKARSWLKRQKVDATDILSDDFIRKLHKQMFSDVWKWAGTYRRSEKNIGVSWVQVARDVRVLCDDARFWIEIETFPPAEIALRFKHRLVSIHCFPNGNGRHARMMADVLMEKAFGLPAFGWNAGNLVNATEERRLYIAALRAADLGDFVPLINFAGV